MRTLNVGVIGHKFMGRAHTYALSVLPIFFDAGVRVVKKMICSNEEGVQDIAQRWGYERYTLDWKDVINSPDIDIVIIAAPSSIHASVSIEAAKAGKHIICEKPLALTVEDAEKMTQAVEQSGVINMVGFNCRRIPAIAFAKQLIDEGKLGEISHFRASYQQDWLNDPNYPLVWRLKKDQAGYGSHGDMGAHLVDLARYLVGEISEVCCQQRTFKTSRPILAHSDGLVAKAGDGFGEVDVDDASSFMANFEGKSTMGYFEATRNGTGHKNKNSFEISGTRGGVIFSIERICELQYYSVDDEKDSTQGFRTIQLGTPEHPYMANWWSAGHNIGYGDTFVNQLYDFVTAVRDNKQVTPNFRDGLINQRVLEAAYLSSKTRSWQDVIF